MISRHIKQDLTRKQKITFLFGLIIFLAGFGILSFLGIRRISRDLHRSRLMRENTVIEIPDLHIKAPVLEGVEQSVLAEAAGHFPGKGSIGSGNYCIAAHSSVLYKEYFNNLITQCFNIHSTLKMQGTAWRSCSTAKRATVLFTGLRK